MLIQRTLFVLTLVAFFALSVSAQALVTCEDPSIPGTWVEVPMGETQMDFGIIFYSEATQVILTEQRIWMINPISSWDPFVHDEGYLIPDDRWVEIEKLPVIERSEERMFNIIWPY
ncbi:MAG: hypothetical protein ABH837_03160 [bacterium]